MRVGFIPTINSISTTLLTYHIPIYSIVTISVLRLFTLNNQETRPKIRSIFPIPDYIQREISPSDGKPVNFPSVERGVGIDLDRFRPPGEGQPSPWYRYIDCAEYGATNNRIYTRPLARYTCTSLVSSFSNCVTREEERDRQTQREKERERNKERKKEREKKDNLYVYVIVCDKVKKRKKIYARHVE